MHTNPIPVRHVVLAVANSVDELLRRRAQQLQLHVEGDELHLEANAFWLARAIANLIRSASDYSEDGAPITLTFEPYGDSLEVRIRNVGSAQRSYRGGGFFDHRGPSDRDGLNLAVARKIIKLHNGEVDAEPLGPGLGMLFIVRLPLQTPAAELAAL